MTEMPCVPVEAITKLLFYTTVEHNDGADGEPPFFD